jgi:hypothetical protein
MKTQRENAGFKPLEIVSSKMRTYVSITLLNAEASQFADLVFFLHTISSFHLLLISRWKVSRKGLGACVQLSDTLHLLCCDIWSSSCGWH